MLDGKIFIFFFIIFFLVQTFYEYVIYVMRKYIILIS